MCNKSLALSRGALHPADTQNQFFVGDDVGVVLPRAARGEGVEMAPDLFGVAGLIGMKACIASFLTVRHNMAQVRHH